MFNRIKKLIALRNLEKNGWTIERTVIANNKKVCITLRKGSHMMLLRYTRSGKLIEVAGKKRSEYRGIVNLHPYTREETELFLKDMKKVK